jgi:FkbM family methyltransferase
MLEITKNDISFNVSGEYSEEWFTRYDSWERNTFPVLDYFTENKKSIYIDIGAWIGPTVLYCANLYDTVIAIEPDPVAIERLEENISANNFDNITLIKKGLSDITGKTKFGGNGDLGNSESTLLVSMDDYSTWGGRHSKEKRESNIIEVETITIEELLDQQGIKPEEISLIKMDIEGGELILVPYLKEFLSKYKQPFYISLHHCFLKSEHIDLILNILFEIYDVCHQFNDVGLRIPMRKETIIENEVACLVFE